MAEIGIDCRLPYYQKGGISQYTIHLLGALAELDDGHVYHVGQMGKDGVDYAPKDARFGRFDLLTPCHHRWERYALAVELYAKKRGLQVWHSPDFIPPLWAGRRLITVHDLNFIYYPQFLTAESRRYYSAQIEWAVRVADHISADSHQTKRDLVGLLGVPAEKVTAVHLSVNPLYQRSYALEEVEATLRQHNLPRGFVLAVGTLEPRKNLPTLLRAYHQLLNEAAVDVPLVLVGRKGWLYDEIFEVVAALGLGEWVRHLEGVYDEQLAHLYHAAGVLATPSHYEGFGLPALEAMNCGCPVVVSGRGSLPEIVGTAGLVLPADDVDAWADGLGRVLGDTAVREAMIAAGRVQAARFSWREAAEKTRMLYERLAAGG